MPLLASSQGFIANIEEGLNEKCLLSQIGVDDDSPTHVAAQLRLGFVDQRDKARRQRGGSAMHRCHQRRPRARMDVRRGDARHYPIQPRPFSALCKERSPNLLCVVVDVERGPRQVRPTAPLPPGASSGPPPQAVVCPRLKSPAPMSALRACWACKRSPPAEAVLLPPARAARPSPSSRQPVARLSALPTWAPASPFSRPRNVARRALALQLSPPPNAGTPRWPRPPSAPFPGCRCW